MTRLTALLLGALSIFSVALNAAAAPSPPPVIDLFFPTEGRGGEILIIQGENFPETTNNLRVFFCEPFDVLLEAPVLDTTATTIAVKVPTNGWPLFQGPAYICIEAGDDLVTTLGIGGVDSFTFIPPPQIIGSVPGNASVLPGGLLRLLGWNFEAEAGNYRVLIDGSYNGSVQLASASDVLVQLPSTISTGVHNLTLQLRDARSAPFEFTVLEPLYSRAGVRGHGLSIRVTRADFSNAPDGQISLLEAVLIANGTLGRPIERHLPCETLPPDDPNKCPPQLRESDKIQFLDEGPNGGPNSRDYVFLDSSITNGTEIFGTLPPLTRGDAYLLRIVLNGEGAAAGTPGLDLNGAGDVSVEGLTLRNYPGHGVWLRNLAFFNRLTNIKVENCGGSGIFLDDDARANSFFGLSVSNAAAHGLALVGTNVWLNSIEASGGSSSPFSAFRNCGFNGILLTDGASFNVISPGSVRENGREGILLWKGNTTHNLIGRMSDEAFPPYPVVNNGLDGVRLTDSVQHCVIRYINASGNNGDGILLGHNVSYNQVDRCSVGANLTEGGTSLDLPNLGSGIHLLNGAQDNLIGSHVVGIGDFGRICGNRDDGILIEGPDTAYNKVCAQQIGLHSITYNPFLRANFVRNGKSGIRLANGTHDNWIGDWQYELPNRIFSSPEAAIMIEGSSTRGNLVSGNQIGSYHQQFNTGVSSENYIGVWIRDGAYENEIGWPGANVVYSTFGVGPPDTGKFFWNVIARCWVGILIESTNSGALPCVDNSIQNNLIGEEEAGGISQGATGIKLGFGAFGTHVGGPSPAYGNRIRANWRAGIWIKDNHVLAPEDRNIIRHNYIAEQGTTGPLRYPGFLNFTPSGGVGLLVENSSGQWLGTNIAAMNTFNWNRFGIYMADSSNNFIIGNYLTNHFLAGIIVRGGSGNYIGDPYPEMRNIVAGAGLGDSGHAGVILSSTAYNYVSGNEIRGLPGRAGMGLFLTNAQLNVIGGDVGIGSPGNIVITNSTNAIVLSGPFSTDNYIAANYIGLLPDGTPMPNRGDGIRFEHGASVNQVGSSFSANYIWYNLGAGVRVDGSATAENSIEFNSITANGLAGIILSNSGNHLVPPPPSYAFDGTNFFGVVDTGAFAAGTYIQVFCDSDAVEPEGEFYLGEAVVQADGTWKAPLEGVLWYPNISLTATHPGFGAAFYSTSQFGSGTVPPNPLHAFAISRTDAVPTATAPSRGDDISVFRLSLYASNIAVRVNSIAFDIAGTMADVSAISGASLYHDATADGLFNPGDRYLAGPIQFTSDNGRITLTPTNAIIEGNTIERWLLVFDLTADAVEGATFQLALANADAVDAAYVNPANIAAVPLAIFPIRSAQFTIGPPLVGQTIGAWKPTVFSPAQLADPAISGNNADPDGDGAINLLEYAYNLDPLVADAGTAPNGDRGAPRASRVLALNPATNSQEEYLAVTFIRRKAPVDLNYYLDHSLDLTTWNQTPATPNLITLATRQDVGAGDLLERVQYRADQPITGPGSAAKQFIRIRVELVP